MLDSIATHYYSQLLPELQSYARQFHRATRVMRVIGSFY